MSILNCYSHCVILTILRLILFNHFGHSRVKTQEDTNTIYLTRMVIKLVPIYLNNEPMEQTIKF